MAKAPKAKVAKKRRTITLAERRRELRQLRVERNQAVAARADALRRASVLRGKLADAEKRIAAAEHRAVVAEERAKERIARAEAAPAKVEAREHVWALARADLADQLHSELEAMSKSEMEWRTRAEHAEARLAGLPADADQAPPLAMCDAGADAMEAH